MTAFLTVLMALSLGPLDETGYRDMVASHKGQVVLVDFWATWCEPCRAELPRLVALQKSLGSALVLATVSADEPEQENDARDFLQKCGAAPPAYIKRAASDQNFIDSIDKDWSGALPALFLYDREGHLRRSFIGETDAKTIEAAVRDLL
jgi:thiol-disulfide isomerase/thioredoxin